CESKELDVEIRNLIEKNNTYQLCEDPKPIAQESLNPQRTLCSLKTHSEANAQGCLGCTWAGVSDMEAPADPLEPRHILLTKNKTVSANSLQQQILSLERQRRELLEVNKQWDHQFRSMKQLYEKQLAEMKAKLDASEMRLGELEEERHRQHPEERLQALGRERPLQETKESKGLSEALHEMKEENKLLKQKNASMIRKKEHYECEISRLNKALLDVLKKQHAPVLGTPSAKGDRNSLEDMRTQLDVLRQQVQIYEEDFRKERSDRERLNEEKEALQKINERLQSQLNKLNSQTKDLPPDYQWYVPDQFPPDVQHKANDSSLEKGARR
ncbi:PREDICTED: TNFAIP3-interacting protein 3, partial [Phaethon lepturus]|uniref:TNFAIP3-interacting protein 3 n=1 Tax=Phaethon lepturus TaxID=97097 RepID=UPI0005304666